MDCIRKYAVTVFAAFILSFSVIQMSNLPVNTQSYLVKTDGYQQSTGPPTWPYKGALLDDRKDDEYSYYKTTYGYLESYERADERLLL